MVNTTSANGCALCGQPVEIVGFTLTSNQGQQKFCCAGCLSIYQLLNEHQTTIEPPPNSEDNNK